MAGSSRKDFLCLTFDYALRDYLPCYGFPVCGSSDAYAQSPIWATDKRLCIKLSQGLFCMSANSKGSGETALIITKTCLYNFDPLKPHFYIVKLGFTGVYIIFLISAQNIDCGYSLEPPHQGGSNEYPQSMFWAEIWKISEFFIWKFSFSGGKLFSIFK